MAMYPKIFKIKTSMFFNRQEVMAKLDKSTLVALRGAGALIRKTARRSLRPRKDPDKSSQPGTPPYSHTGKLRRSILFGLDPNRESVVIGPSATFGNTGIPGLHEFGGTHTIKARIDSRAIVVGETARIGNREFEVRTMAEAQAIAKFYNKALKYRKGRQKYYATASRKTYSTTTATYPARPYMLPALTKMIPRIREEFPKTFGEAWKSPI